MAQWTTWVPVWLRRISSRRSGVDARHGRLAGGDLALDEADVMAVQAGQGVGGVDHPDLAGVGGDPAGVADLAALLGVERASVEHDRVAHHRQHGGLGLDILAADELGRTEPVEHVLIAVEALVVVDLASCGLGPLALLGHERVEAVDVDLDPPLRRDLLGDLEGEAEGVVELEGEVAGHRLGFGGQGGLEHGDAPGQRGPEPLLLAPDDVGDVGAVLAQVGVGVGHRVDGARRPAWA